MFYISCYYALFNLMIILGVLFSPFQGMFAHLLVPQPASASIFVHEPGVNNSIIFSFDSLKREAASIPFFQDSCQTIIETQMLDELLNIAGQENCYVLPGIAGDRLTLRLDNQTEESLQLSILNPNQSQLVQSVAYIKLEITIELPEDGDYVILIKSIDEATGPYSLDILYPNRIISTTADGQNIVSNPKSSDNKNVLNDSLNKSSGSSSLITLSLPSNYESSLGWWVVPSASTSALDEAALIKNRVSGSLAPGEYDIYVTTQDLEQQPPLALRIARSVPIKAGQLITIPVHITEVTSSLPQIGPITFALDVSEDYEPIYAATRFNGEVTEIHAVFEYSGLSPELMWERVWYLDGAEILRSAERWSGDEIGTFDYFISAGGTPLSSGEWFLELYVEGQLLGEGGFTITSNQETGISAQTTEKQDQLPAVALTPTPAPPPRPKTYRLAYTKWDGGKHNLYIGDTNGSSEQFIISRAAGPSWADDGQSVYFYGEEGVDRQEVGGVQYVFDSVSNGIVNVSLSPIPTNISEVRLSQPGDWKGGTIRWTSVSPSGQMLAYDARPGGDYRIYFLGTDVNQQYKFEIIGEQADWAPDSQRLVYRSSRNNQTGIWISNRDDSGHIRITQGGSDSFPAWSPDGKTITFSRDDGGNVNLYAVNVDGTNLRRLTEALGPDTLPIYTADGQIIFRSARSGSWGIWKMNGDGSNQQEIIPNAGVGPDWAYSKMDVYTKH